jgi:hypothetical protein
MRIFAAHDAQGSIEYVVINPPDAPPATVKIEGLLVTEVDASEMISGLDLSDPEGSRRQLTEVLKRLSDSLV